MCERCAELERELAETKEEMETAYESCAWVSGTQLESQAEIEELQQQLARYQALNKFILEYLMSCDFDMNFIKEFEEGK